MAEERMTDDPFKPKVEGDEGAEALGFVVNGEEEEYDEDLVGLTPSKLQEKLEEKRRAEEKAAKEKERLLKSAAQRRAAGKYEEAAMLYGQALVYGADGEAEKALWACHTAEYSSTDCFYRPEVMDELDVASERAREGLLSKMGAKIREERAEYEKEAAPLREQVKAAMEERREAFVANRNYWRIRFIICGAAVIIFALACLIASNYIVRTQGLTAPVLTAVFGGLALIALGVMFLFARKLFVAQRLVNDNEKLSSTENGARLADLEYRIGVLDAVLNPPEAAEEEALPAEEA